MYISFEKKYKILQKKNQSVICPNENAKILDGVLRCKCVHMYCTRQITVSENGNQWVVRNKKKEKNTKNQSSLRSHRHQRVKFRAKIPSCNFWRSKTRHTTIFFFRLFLNSRVKIEPKHSIFCLRHEWKCLFDGKVNRGFSSPTEEIWHFHCRLASLKTFCNFCRLLVSLQRGLYSHKKEKSSLTFERKHHRFGFWSCQLHWPLLATKCTIRPYKLQIRSR